VKVAEASQRRASITGGASVAAMAGLSGWIMAQAPFGFAVL
jgi:hypothetical protein